MPRAAHPLHLGPAPPRRWRGVSWSLLYCGSALCFGTAPSIVSAAMTFDTAALLDDASIAGSTAASVNLPRAAPSSAPMPAPPPSPAPLSFGKLPSAPPPLSPRSAASTQPSGLLFLELILNGRATKSIIPVRFENGSISLRPQDLQQLGVKIHSNGDLLHIADIPQARFEYHAAAQSLSLHLPDHLLPQHIIGRARERLQITPAETAILLSYDAFISTGLQNSDPQISLFLEPRITGRFGVFTSSGLWRNGPYGGYKRYDSSFRTSDAGSATTWEFGDFITRNLSQASAVRLGGVQVSRDFAVRPDIITYPMPRFAGRAALPSTVELLVDGRSLINTQVDPGQFLLDTLPLGSGAGEAQLVVTDIHGNAVTANLPFYISSNLLASGLTDFAVSAGFFRKDYAVKNFSYGDVAASASLRHGLTDTLTGEIRAETSRDFWLLGGGIQSRLATWGILSASVAHSHYRGQSGQQISFGYDYQAGSLSLALRHMRQSRNYHDLGELGDDASPTGRHQSIAGVNLSMGRAGSIGLNYAEYRDGRQPSTRYANLNYARPIFARGQLYAQAGRDLRSKGWNASLTFSLSLGGRGGSLSAGIADQSHGERSYRMDYSRSVPSDSGIGWNIGGSYAENGSTAWRADMQLRTRPAQFRFGGAGAHHRGGANYQNIWAGASGGLVYMDGIFVASNQLPSSFAVVSTNGFGDIPVRYENQLMGRTNQSGKLFIPNMAPWYSGKVSIDPLDLPADITVPDVERRVAVESGRGVHIRFALAKSQPALATLRLPSGEFVPAGSAVMAGGQILTHIGWDGLLYLEDINAAPKGLLTIITTDQSSCHTALPTSKLTPENWNLGDLPCSPL